MWNEGICGDGAAILKDGAMVPIEEVIDELNKTINTDATIEDALKQLIADSCWDEVECILQMLKP